MVQTLVAARHKHDGKHFSTGVFLLLLAVIMQAVVLPEHCCMWGRSDRRRKELKGDRDCSIRYPGIAAWDAQPEPPQCRHSGAGDSGGDNMALPSMPPGSTMPSWMSRFSVTS